MGILVLKEDYVKYLQIVLNPHYHYYTDGKHFYRGDNCSYHKLAGLKYCGMFHNAKEAKESFSGFDR